MTKNPYRPRTNPVVGKHYNCHQDQDLTALMFYRVLINNPENPWVVNQLKLQKKHLKIALG